MTPRPRSPDHLRSSLTLWLFALGPFFVGLIWQKQLSADGAHYVVSLLEQQHVFVFAASRWAANYVTQWPIVVALQAGMRDVHKLTLLYGLGLLFPFALALALSARFRPADAVVACTFPVLSLWVINLPIDYVIAHELHTGSTLIWPLFFLLTRAQPLDVFSRVVGALLLLVTAQSYEALGVTLGVVALATIDTALRLPTAQKQERLAWAGAVTIAAIYTFSQGFSTSLSPNRADFIANILSMLSNATVMCAVVAAIAWFAWLLRPHRRWLTIMLIAGGVFLIGTVTNLFVCTAGVSYSTRTNAIVWLPLLVGAAALVLRSPSTRTRFGTNRSAQVWLLTAALFTTGHVIRQRHWAAYYDYFHTVLRGAPGYVSWDDFPIDLHWQGWSWTNPELSLLWSPSPVRVIVTNPPDVYWAPFDPRNYLPLPEWFELDPAVQPNRN